eukprot:TRINITY_DN10530_c0_g1_i1.p1 TRINITY_DN10530_c0_g1~~TRINITY_DN10530_c0_g1_i1.p1  ORF type:complete len:277 (+),score=88.79 TRINITY_DN10530_c0_g1_i1:83-832(+)
MALPLVPLDGALLAADALEHKARGGLRELERHQFSVLQELCATYEAVIAAAERRLERERDAREREATRLGAQLREAERQAADLQSIRRDADQMRGEVARDAELDQAHTEAAQARGDVSALEKRLAEAESRAARAFRLEAQLQDRTEALKDLARELKAVGHPLTELAQLATSEPPAKALSADDLLGGGDESLTTEHALHMRRALRERRQQQQVTAADLLAGTTATPIHTPARQSQEQGGGYSDDEFDPDD